MYYYILYIPRCYITVMCGYILYILKWRFPCINTSKHRERCPRSRDTLGRDVTDRRWLWFRQPDSQFAGESPVVVVTDHGFSVNSRGHEMIPTSPHFEIQYVSRSLEKDLSYVTDVSPTPMKMTEKRKRIKLTETKRGH